MTSLDSPVRTASPAASWSVAARVAGALTLTLSGLLWAVADLIEPDLNGADSLTWTAAHPGPAGIAITADMLATPCLLGATAVWLLLSRRRSPRLAWAGAVLLVLGLTGQAMIMGVGLVGYMVARSGEIDPAVFSAVVGDGPDPSLPGTVFMAMFFVGAFVGIVVMMVAVWRSRALPRAAAALLVAFQLTELVNPPFPSTLIAAAGLVWMAVALLRTPVAESIDGRGGVMERR
ncbi:hypothetical protein [Sphaerisporangium perillae]|uniref:hypothetical protein n=1 Tax=Sphaerisporangium perillae TaxID=2935860 RepID=UPI00200D07A0|nr:hypothetical protein [Sphaerisporangium perillae]